MCILGFHMMSPLSPPRGVNSKTKQNIVDCQGESLQNNGFINPAFGKLY